MYITDAMNLMQKTLEAYKMDFEVEKNALIEKLTSYDLRDGVQQLHGRFDNLLELHTRIDMIKKTIDLLNK